MVIVGDADGVRPEHAVEMFNLRGGGDEVAAATGEIDGIPAARLVILPAASHIFGVPRRRRPGAGSHPVALREQNGAGREYSNMSASGRNRADRAMRAIVGRIRRLPKRRSGAVARASHGVVLRSSLCAISSETRADQLVVPTRVGCGAFGVAHAIPATG